MRCRMDEEYKVHQGLAERRAHHAPQRAMMAVSRIPLNQVVELEVEVTS